jgi:ABC-type Fe3+-hydroxamate transport system substrate-binding protein
VFDLGRGADLVGITDYCVHPADGVDAIEKVGGTKTPTVSRIIELEPHLVLLNDEENRIEDARALEAAGLTCFSSLPRSPAETAAMVRSIGKAIDRTELADKIASEIERRINRVRGVAAERPGVRFAYLIWRKPWMSVNGDTFAHSLLALAGGLNVFGEHSERYPVLTGEDLREASPSILLLGSEPFPFAEAHADELARIADMDRSRIQLVDGEYLSWHGSRTPDGIDYAATVIERARTDASWGLGDC